MNLMFDRAPVGKLCCCVVTCFSQLNFLAESKNKNENFVVAEREVHFPEIDLSYCQGRPASSSIISSKCVLTKPRIAASDKG
jgi:hypothetical protein